MKFQFRLMTLLVATVTLGLVVGANIRTQWRWTVYSASGGEFAGSAGAAYGWPIPFYFMETGGRGPAIKFTGLWRRFGPGIELDLFLFDALVAGVLVLAACYALKMFQGRPK